LSKKKLVILIAVPLLLCYVSLFVGRYGVQPHTVVRILLSKIFPIAPDWSASAETIVLAIRMPRTLLAMCVGAGLAISGAAYQGMFRNPLVSTDILGVSSAAGFGAALALLFSGNALEVQLVSIVLGLAGVGLTYLISRVYKTTPVLMLVLSGVVVAAFFSSLISATKYIADPDNKLPAITYWLLGSLSGASYKNLVTVVPMIVIGSAGLLFVRWPLNVLAMGDDEARSLGIRTELLKGVVIVCTTVITAAAVSVSGLIGWIGLMIPHAGRMIVGPNHHVLLPTTLAIGAAYLVLIDTLARTITPQEIALGILTSVVGAPFLAYLLRRTKGGWR
jgi:iron complex transport system permease protein